HPWLRLAPAVRATLISVLDDATKRLLYAQLWPAETTAAVFGALHAVFTTWGLPIALYTDRAGWAFHTPKAGGPIDRTHLTQIGRALERLGVEHIGAYSPQAGVRGTVRRDVHGMISVWHGARCFGRYDGQGRPLALDQPKNARAHLPQDRRSITISSPGIPRLRANAKRRCRPRLPTGPRD